ncbi:MAG: VOC family protein [candidate division Zixibacteria bacterium]|nr:VOC family protein [candidate division Zixibacteria bacterium]
MFAEITNEPGFVKYVITLASMGVMSLAVGANSVELEAETNSEAKQPPAIWAVQINVTDLDKAINFYTKILGMEIATREYYPVVVSLKNDGGHILLYAVDKKAQARPSKSVTYVNWQVPNLAQAIERLKASDATLLDDEPEDFALGKSLRCLDPFGNFMNVLELDPKFGSIQKSALFNVGLPITDLESARSFYAALGINGTTDKYWPPVVPLDSRDIELILHESETTVPLEYPGKTGAFIIITVDNIRERVKELKKLGYKFLYDEIVTHAPVGDYTALRDPFGQVVELIEPSSDNAFDKARNLDRADAD